LILIDFISDELKGGVVFNGPEHIALQHMPATWSEQRAVSKRQIRLLNCAVAPQDRLPVVDPAPKRGGVASS
jgi:hypothetical protein